MKEKRVVVMVSENDAVVGLSRRVSWLKTRKELRRSKINPLLLSKKVSVLLRVLLLPGNSLRVCLQACLRRS